MSTAKPLKLVVTNVKQLKLKHGTGYQRIKSSITRLIAADKERGLVTRLIDLSSPAAMKSVGGKSVAAHDNRRANKSAIDKICVGLRPHYLLILGAPDVVPHQMLDNPLYGADDDLDEFVPSDLPYACESAHSSKIEDFLSPTRVVGRLPDLQQKKGATNTKFLTTALDAAANWSGRRRAEYELFFAVTAAAWKKSTTESLENIFGNAGSLKHSPPDGPNWSKAMLSRLSHFFNCHGGPADPQFYGDDGDKNPVCMRADLLDGQSKEGAVIAAECCYGAEIYPPDRHGTHGICTTYLGNQAYAVFGSSTIAYGPAEGNSAADLMTQYFFKSVLTGASTGRSALQARQEYVLKHSMLDPVDLKTLAQFNLLGDPSIHPVYAEGSEPPPPATTSRKSAAKSKQAAKAKFASPLLGISRRRESLLLKGQAIGQASMSIDSTSKTPVTGQAHKILTDLLGSTAESRFFSFDVTEGKSIGPQTIQRGFLRAEEKNRVEVAIGKLASRETGPRLVAVISRERNGEREIRTYFSR